MIDKISVILIDDNPPHHLRINEQRSNSELTSEQTDYDEQIGYDESIDYDEQTDYSENADYDENIRYIDLISDNEQTFDVNIPTLDACTKYPFSKYFDLKWFSSIAEVREYRDSIRMIAHKSPTTLTKEKLIGEIICFDYAMTKDIRPVSQRYTDLKIVERLSLLPVLPGIRERLGITLEKPATDIPEWGGNNDDQGCFAGGLLFSLLADYPCAPVALTVKEDGNISPAVKFFEWMLENDANHAFENKGRPEPKWDDLLLEGVQTLRKRIEELATAGIIYLNLDDLMNLVEPEANAMKHEEPTLTFHSRYGKKSLPVNGLFIDISEETRSEVVKEWAKSLLKKLLGNYNIEDIKKGMEFAENLFKAYTNLPLRKQRRLLSESVQGLKEYWLNNDADNDIPDYLVTKITSLGFVTAEIAKSTPEGRALGEDHRSIGKKILKKYMRLYIRASKGPEKTILRRRFENCWGSDESNELEAMCMTPSCVYDLRSGTYTPRQRRWAILFMIVKLHKFRWDALKKCKNELDTQKMSSGKYILLRARRNLLREAITVQEIYDALYPLPRDDSPILPRDLAGTWPHATRLGGQVSRETAHELGLTLRFNNGKEKNNSTYGKLALVYDDILQSKNWTDNPDCPDNQSADHGFMKGERTILIMYAESFNKETNNSNNWDWKKDNSMSAILGSEVHNP